jgi:uncharacterized protein (DUF2236 family)
MKENFRRTDKPRKRKRISYEPASQAAVREAIKKAHRRIVGEEPAPGRVRRKASP